MADWVKIYEEAEDDLMKMLEERSKRRKAQQIIKDSLQGTTGATTMSQEEKPQREFKCLN